MMAKNIFEIEIKTFAHKLIDSGRIGTASEIAEFTVEYLEKRRDKFPKNSTNPTEFEELKKTQMRKL